MRGGAPEKQPPSKIKLSDLDKRAEPPHDVDYLRCDEAIINDTRSQSRVRQDLSALEEPHFREHEYLTREDVILAIAAVLEGRRQDNINFAYGPVELFAVRTKGEVVELEPAITPVGSGDHLIIPIMLDDDPPPPSQSFSGTLAANARPQAVLAVASVNNAGLAVAYYVSTDTRTLNLTPYQEVARAIIERWAPVKADPRLLDGFPSSIVPAPASMTRPNGFSTARIHLVLNAWAFIYDDPVAEWSNFQVKNAESLFYRAARTMVSLRCRFSHPD